MKTISCQSSASSNIPDHIWEQLKNAPKGVKGARHQYWRDLSYQMVGERITDDTIFAFLREAIPDPDKSDADLDALISGAHKRNPKPSVKLGYSLGKMEYRGEGAQITIAPLKYTRSAELSLPAGEDIRPIDFLKLAFEPWQVVCLNNDTRERDGKECLNGHGLFQTVSEWKQWFEEQGHNVFDGSVGCWMRINPFLDGTTEGKDGNVQDFRHLLIEFDNKPKAEQLDIMKHSGLPVRFVIDSGGDSLHFWIDVKASTIEQFKERQKAVYAFLDQYLDDKGNKNPSRFSRLPGVLRKEKGAYQRLIAQNIGAASYEEWEEGQIVDNSERFDLDDLFSFDRKNDSNRMIGNRWLCKGGSLVVQGYTGIGKSSLLLQMAISWSLGEDFFKIVPIRPLKTVFVQAENDKGDFAEAFQDICESLALTTDEKEFLKQNFIPIREASAAGVERFSRFIRSQIRKHGPDIIFLDPLLSYFGDDIIRQEKVSQFFRNMLQPIQNETGVMFVFAHHLGKPPAQGTVRSGPSHYHGLGSSDIQNWTREIVTLTEETPGVYLFDAGKRSKRLGIEGDLYLKHSANGVVWERADASSKRDIDDVKRQTIKRKIVEFIRQYGLVTLEQLKQNAKPLGSTQNGIQSIADAIVADLAGTDSPIYWFKAHANDSDAKSKVYSVNPAPVGGRVQTVNTSARLSVETVGNEVTVEMEAPF